MLCFHPSAPKKTNVPIIYALISEYKGWQINLLTSCLTWPSLLTWKYYDVVPKTLIIMSRILTMEDGLQKMKPFPKMPAFWAKCPYSQVCLPVAKKQSIFVWLFMQRECIMSRKCFPDILTKQPACIIVKWKREFRLKIWRLLKQTEKRPCKLIKPSD